MSRPDKMPRGEVLLHAAFRLGIWLKAAHSIIEIAAGIALMAVSNAFVLQLAQTMTAAELLEDPNDAVAGVVRGFAQSFSPASQSFAAYYLLSHGLIKLAMVAGVLLGRPWAYPGFIAVMASFIFYQLYRLSFGLGWGLVAVTLLDGVVLALAVHEYRIVRSAGTR